MQRVRVALIGYGYWGTNLARNIAAHPDAELATVCDSAQARRDQARARFPSAKTTAETEAAITDSNVDLVVVATPASTHYALAVRALECGKDVFVEKPLCLSETEAGDLCARVAASNRILMVGHTFLYNSFVHDVRRRLDNGDLGEVLYIYSERLNLGIFREDEDVIWTLAPHDISIANYWLRERPVRVSARGSTHIFKSRALSELAFIQLDYPGGAIVYSHLSWLSPRKRRTATLVGAKAMLVYDDIDSDRHIAIYDKGVQVITADGRTEDVGEVSDLAEHQTYIRTGDVLLPNVRLREPLTVEIEHLIECVLTRHQPVSDVRNGAEVVAVIAAIQASLKNGGAITGVEYGALTLDPQPA